MRSPGPPDLGKDHALAWTSPRPRRTSQAQLRVLVEVADGAEAWSLWRALTDGGYQVSWCPGPPRGAAEACPLISSGYCSLVEEADAVVSNLAFADRRQLAVLHAQGRHFPETPVLIALPSNASTEVGALPPCARRITYPLMAKTVAKALATVLGTFSTHDQPSRGGDGDGSSDPLAGLGED